MSNVNQCQVINIITIYGKVWKPQKLKYHKYFKYANMTNEFTIYDFLSNNNTFSIPSCSGLRDINKYTMDPSSKTRAVAA